MSSRENSVQKHGGVGVQAQISDSLIMHNTAAHDTLGKLNGNENNKYFQDRAAMEFDSQVKAQKEEIQFLRKQIAAACVREVQSLNEKFVLERKFSELRMAKDEKHHEAITSSLEELARRKGDLEENLKLANDLKVVHEETCIFMSSMLGLLSEYGVLPRVISTSSILSNIKQLHDELQWKVRILHDFFKNKGRCDVYIFEPWNNSYRAIGYYNLSVTRAWGIGVKDPIARTLSWNPPYLMLQTFGYPLSVLFQEGD